MNRIITMAILAIAIIDLRLSFINHKQQKKIMSDQDKFAAQLDRIDTATNNIASELKSLKDEIAGQGLPADVEQAVLARLTSAADKLEGIAAPPVPIVDPNATPSGTAAGSTGSDSGLGSTEPPTATDAVNG